MAPFVPDDIILLVFDLVEDKQDLCALSLVSHRFKQIANAYLYRDYINDSGEPLRPFWPFLRTLLSNPELGHRLRYAAFRPWRTRKGDSTFLDDQISRYFEPLGQNDFQIYKAAINAMSLFIDDNEREILDASIESEEESDARDMVVYPKPFNVQYPCESAEITLLLSLMPNLETFRVDGTSHSPGAYGAIRSFSPLLNEVPHFLMMLREVELIQLNFVDDDDARETFAYFFSCSSIAIFKCILRGDVANIGRPDMLQRGTRFPSRISTIRHLLIYLSAPSESYVRLLFNACATVEKFTYANGGQPDQISDWKEQLDFSKMEKTQRETL